MRPSPHVDKYVSPEGFPLVPGAFGCNNVRKLSYDPQLNVFNQDSKLLQRNNDPNSTSGFIPITLIPENANATSNPFIRPQGYPFYTLLPHNSSPQGLEHVTSSFSPPLNTVGEKISHQSYSPWVSDCYLQPPQKSMSSVNEEQMCNASSMVLKELLREIPLTSAKESLELLSSSCSKTQTDVCSTSFHQYWGTQTEKREHQASDSPSCRVKPGTLHHTHWYKGSGLSEAQIRRRENIQRIRELVQHNYFYPTPYETPEKESLGLYIQRMSALSPIANSLPRCLTWCELSQDTQWKWKLGAFLERRLKDSILSTKTSTVHEETTKPYLLKTTRDRENAVSQFCSLQTRLQQECISSFDAFEPLLLCHDNQGVLLSSLQSASYSVVHQSPKLTKDECPVIPLPLYPFIDQDEHHRSTTNKVSLSPTGKWCDTRDNCSTHHVWLSNVEDNDPGILPASQTPYDTFSSGRKYFKRTENGYEHPSARMANNTPWDIEEIPIGALWNEAVLEPFTKENNSVNPDNGISIFWGEYRSNGVYLATRRYTAMQNTGPPNPGDLAELAESFAVVDRVTDNEIHLQLCLLRSLSAYRIENDIEKAVAFTSFIRDVNDDDMFFSKHPSKITDTLLVDESVSPTHDTIEKQASSDDSVEDDIVSASSGLLSDVPGDCSSFTINGTFGVTLGSVTNDRLTKDKKVPDKKLQLKKRSLEKEKRIRLALLGLLPHVARNVEDVHHATKAPDQGIPTSPSSTALVKPNNAIKEYRELRRRYRSRFMMERLRPVTHYDTPAANPYITQSHVGVEERDSLELRHSRSAFLFLGVASQVFPTYVTRFHRPDMRTGFYETFLSTKNSRGGSLSRGSSDNTRLSRLILNVGRNAQHGVEKTALANSCAAGSLGPFDVWGVQVSSLMSRAHAQLNAVSSENLNTGECSEAGHATPLSSAPHPADLIEKAEDLTLTDTLPIALFEYSEQWPPLLNNIGMVAQITKYYRPFGDHVTLLQAKKKIRGRLGRFGRLKLVESYIPFFAGQMKLARNQGVVVVQTRLFKAPVFPHPTNPHSALKVDPARVHTSRYGTGRFHDFRATDFLLIRSNKLSPTGHPTFVFHLRPIYLEPLHSESIDDCETNEHGNLAACTLYTVGQTQPLLEVPSPKSKRCLEIRRDWLRAYALRLARQGITDFQTVKTRCQAKFGDTFETGVLQKHLLSCRDTLSMSNSPGYPSQGLLGVNIRVVSEEALRAICSPDVICALESCMIAHYNLLQAGVMVLRSPDRVSSAVRDLETEESSMREHLSRAKKALVSNIARYQQLMRTLSTSDPLRQCWEAQSVTLDEKSTFFDSVCEKRYAPIARLVEEMLLLTPWNITRDCIDVVTRHGAQFTLDGIGDPSGGRGEGISLIRVHNAGKAATLTGGTSSKNIETPKEDLRKLSMKELHDRLIKFGFDSQIVKSLPRWDQVALVRTFQYDNSYMQGEDGSQGKSGRISSDLYMKRLNEIFLNQRIALEPDEPQLTASDSDSSGNREDDNQPVSDQNAQTTDLSATGDDTKRVPQDPSDSIHQSSSNLPLEPNLEDELLSGLQSRDDEDGSETSVTDKNFDSVERKALEEFRESLGKHRKNVVYDVSARMISKFSPRELQFLQAKPIPRLAWTRKTLDHQTGEVKKEKIVYIYGYENIRLFYEWRRKRHNFKRSMNTYYPAGGNIAMGTASRTCRRCGQIGHISSNPICPQHTGPRRPRISQHPSPYGGGASSHHLVPSGYASSDEEKGDDLDSMVSKHVGSTEKMRRPPGSKRGRRVSSTRSELDKDERFYKMVKHARGKSDDYQLIKAKGGADNKPPSSTLKLPTRTTARQRLILENKGTLAGVAVQTYQGSYENAVNEINQIFQRVISKTDRDKRKWAVFREKVSEADAPGYNAVVTNPIWLNKMVEKCKAREYRSTATFLSDIQLLVDNCFRYNPPGHWIRPLVQSLGDFLRDETESQGPWLIELDRFIQQHCQDNPEAA